MSFSLLRSVRSSLQLNSVARFSSSSRWQFNATQFIKNESSIESTTTANSDANIAQTIVRRRAPINKPEDFINAIAKPRRGDLKSILSALGEENDMKALLTLDGSKLKVAGVPVKERRYFLWCLERFKQGQHPSEVAYDVKPKKKVRGWGPRVQNGVRIRGVKRPGEK